MGALAPGNGVRQRHDLLATTVRLAPGWRLGHDPPRLARSPRRNRPDRLGAGLAGCSECTRAKGGQKTGPNPTDRGKTGSKRHLIVDGRGTPLAIRHTAANRHETTMVEELVDAVPAIRWPRGRVPATYLIRPFSMLSETIQRLLDRGLTRWLTSTCLATGDCIASTIALANDSGCLLWRTTSRKPGRKTRCS